MLIFTEPLAKSETSLLVRNVVIEKTGDYILNILMAVFFQQLIKIQIFHNY